MLVPSSFHTVAVEIEHEATARPEILARLESLQRLRGGRLYVKVELAAPSQDGWPAGTAALYLDGVLFEAHPSSGVVLWADAQEEFEDDVSTMSPLLIAARYYADRTIFGLLLAAQDLLPRRYPAIGRVRLGVIANVDKHDANMDWVYERRGIEVIPAEDLMS